MEYSNLVLDGDSDHADLVLKSLRLASLVVAGPLQVEAYDFWIFRKELIVSDPLSKLDFVAVEDPGLPPTRVVVELVTPPLSAHYSVRIGPSSDYIVR